jgi:acyl carrier protein
MIDPATDVSARIRTFIGEELLAEKPMPPLDDGTPLLNGLLDSSELMQLVTYLEEEFDVLVDDAEITTDSFATVGSIARLVEDKRTSVPGSPAGPAAPQGTR